MEALIDKEKSESNFTHLTDLQKRILNEITKSYPIEKKEIHDIYLKCKSFDYTIKIIEHSLASKVCIYNILKALK